MTPKNRRPARIPHSALRIPHSTLRTRTRRAEAGRRRTGKIARLPKHYRDFINFMISEGYPYAEIIRDLENTPGFHHLITKHNLSTWKKGGYQDWLEDQQWLTQRRLDQDFALDLLEKNEKTPIHEATLHVAVTQIAQALRHFDPASLQQAPHDQPANYLRLLDVLAKLSFSGLQCEQRRQEKAKRKEIWEQTVNQFVAREKSALRRKAAELKALKSKLNSKSAPVAGPNNSPIQSEAATGLSRQSEAAADAAISFTAETNESDEPSGNPLVTSPTGA